MLYSLKASYLQMFFLVVTHLKVKKKQFSFNNHLNFSCVISKKSCTFDIE
jgi:hypothetical protein